MQIVIKVVGHVLGLAGLVVGACGCAGGGSAARDEAALAAQTAREFRRPDGAGRTIFSAPPVPGPSATRLASGMPGPAYWQQRADYTIEAALDEPTRKVTGKERVRYANNSPTDLGFVWFNLEQNLFREDSDGALLTKPNGRFGNRDRHEGGFTIGKVQVNGRDAKLHEYGTVGRVDLAQAMHTGEMVEITMEWSFIAPKYGSDRMGVADCKDGPVFEIAQWFPCVCAYDDVHGWNTLPYLGQGEFYTDFGDFDVSITAPAEHLVVGSGELVNPGDVLTAEQHERLKKARESEETVMIRSVEEIDSGKKEPHTESAGAQTKTWKFAAKNVRTFAWASSAAFIWDGCGTLIPGHTERTLCQAFYPREAMPAWDPKTNEGGSSQMLKKSIDHYSKMWLPYPYSTATNVNGIVGGMEYPTIVFCSARENGKGLWGVTTHEIGHNWFPMTVSTNERLHAWMDEGFNTFINYYASKERYPADEPHRGSAAKWGRSYKNPMTQPIELPADQIEGGALGVLEYEKTAVGLVLLREEILGEERFDAAFREYCRVWAFKHPYPGDFFRIMENVSGMDLGWFWNGWFYGTGVLDQSVETVMQPEGDKGLARITFLQRGGLVMPITYRVTYVDGSVENRRVPVEGFFTSDRFTAVVPTGGKKIREVKVDPDDAMPDVERRNNVWK